MTKQSARYFAVKVEVLKFYGPNKECRCSVYGCDVYDPDMLTLDHPNDDGAKELVQDKNHHRAVRDYYGHRKNLVEGSRHTMCWNHNNKKELMRRRLCASLSYHFSITQKESLQREALQRLLANRTATIDYSQIGALMLNENLGWATGIDFLPHTW